MRQGFKTEVNYFLLSLAFSLLFGFGVEQPLLVLLIGLSGYLAWTFFRLRKLFSWIVSDSTSPPGYIPGVVGTIGDHIYRLQNNFKRASEEQQSQVEQFNSLSNALSEGMIVLSSNKELEWWNPAASELLRLKEDDRGRPIQNLLRNPAFVAFIYQDDYERPLEIISPINALQTLLFTAARFDDDNIVLIVTDISRLRKLEKMREDFVANLTHEIKTPLTVLTGYIETLQDNVTDEHPIWKKALDQMAAQAERMNNLTVDLITLSQLEAKSNPPRKSMVTLKPLLAQVVEDARALCNNSHILELESVGSNLALRGDQKELYSAFSNLVVNAIRHNPAGTQVRITVETLPRAGVHVNVIDNGVGISPKHISRLTERFYRVDASRSTDTGGTGLGLAIVKHVLARHDGKLEITSTPGQGSTFSCQFRQND